MIKSSPIYVFFLYASACTVGLDYTKIGEEELKIDEGSSSEPSDDSSNSSGGTASGGSTTGGGSGGNTTGGGSTTGGSSGGSTTGGSTTGGSTTGGSSGGSTTGGSSGGSSSGSTTGSQPTSIIVSSYWEGDLTRASGSYYGEESYDLNDGSYPTNQFNCRLVWDLLAQDDTSSNCLGCTFQVKVQATPQSGSHIVNDGTCTGDFITTAFGYGLTSSYPGYEGSVVMMYASASMDTYGNTTLQDFQGWFVHDSTQTSPYMNTAGYDSNSDTFHYTYGYLNYEYFYY